MKHLFTLLLIIWALIDSAQAQTNFVDGFVITNVGDTLHGYIDDQNWRKNPGFIRFKVDESAEIIKYQSTDIQAFAVIGGDYYESHNTAVDYSPYRASGLSAEAISVIRQETLFLKVLVKGTLSLYSLYDSDGKTHFFIEKEDIPTQELIVRRVLKTDGSKQYVQAFDEYKGQLIKAISNCINLQSQLANLEYKTKALTEFIIAYNNCTGSSSYVNVTKKIAWQIGAVAGVSQSNIQFKSDGFIGLTGGDFQSSTNPFGGISLNIVPPWNRGRLSLYNELSYKLFSSESTYEDVRAENLRTLYNNSFDFSYLKITNMIRLQLFAQSVRPFIQAGIANGFLLKDDNVQIRQIQRLNIMETEIGPMLERLNENEQNLAIGVGAVWQRWSLELRYERGNGISEFNNLQSPTQTFYLLAGFRLFN